PLAVGPGNLDLGGLRRLDLDAGRNRHLDIVAEAKLQLEVPGVRLGAVADAVDLELDREAVRHALHHIAREVAGRAPLRAGAPRVEARLEAQLVAVLRDLDIVMHDERQLALLALDLEGLAREVDG